MRGRAMYFLSAAVWIWPECSISHEVWDAWSSSVRVGAGSCCFRLRLIAPYAKNPKIFIDFGMPANDKLFKSLTAARD